MVFQNVIRTERLTLSLFFARELQKWFRLSHSEYCSIAKTNLTPNAFGVPFRINHLPPPLLVIVGEEAFLFPPGGVSPAIGLPPPSLFSTDRRRRNSEAASRIELNSTQKALTSIAMSWMLMLLLRINDCKNTHTCHKVLERWNKNQWLEFWRNSNLIGLTLDPYYVYIKK